MLSRIILALSMIGAVLGSNFPPAPENVTTLQSKFGRNVTISYKEVKTEPRDRRHEAHS